MLLNDQCKLSLIIPKVARIKSIPVEHCYIRREVIRLPSSKHTLSLGLILFSIHISTVTNGIIQTVRK